MDFWTSANPPWWLSVLTLLIGLFGAHFTTKFSDDRRFRAEEDRLAKVHAEERARYLQNRLLDEVGLLLGAVESFRLNLLTRMGHVERGEDTKVAETEANVALMADIFLGPDDVLGTMPAQFSRVLMIADGPLAELVSELGDSTREFYDAGWDTMAHFNEANREVERATSAVIDAMRGEVNSVA